MEFGFTPAENVLRQEIRQFVKRELPPDVNRGIPNFEEQFHGCFWEVAKELTPKLGARHWLAPGWPEEYGGQGAPPRTHIICQEELAYWGVPGSDMGVGGISWIGPSLMRLGTKEQKKDHLPPIARGETVWCTGYSEPGSGSDMASLQTKAAIKSEHYVVNGQKIWTSAAHVSDWCWILVRTNPDASKHRGLSLMLLDLHTKGVTINPIAGMAGITPFAEIFLEDVKIPRCNLVGEADHGWNYVVESLDYERAWAGLFFSAQSRRVLDELVKLILEIGSTTPSRSLVTQVTHKLANIAVQVEISRLLAHQACLLLLSGSHATSESAMSKLFSTELTQKISRVSMRVLGLYGQLDASFSGVPLGGQGLFAYLSSVGNTILAGTSEVERSVIAQRGLGLPK